MIRLPGKNEKSLVGLEIEAGSIAATEVRSNGSTSVAATAIAPLAPEVFRDGEVADPDALGEALKGLFAEHKLSKRVRLGIANQRVVVRTLRLPMIEDPKELDAAVRFQAQEQIPMPIDQAVLDHRVVGGVVGDDEDASPKVDVVVIAARRDMVNASLEPLRKAGLKPVGVDLSAFGMIRALGNVVAPAPDGPPADPGAPKPPSATLFCNVGDATNLAIAKGRSCLFTRVAPVGLESIAAGLASTSGLTREHALMWINHVGLERPAEEIAGDPRIVSAVRSGLEDGASALRDEIRLSLDFYNAQEGAIPVDRVVLSGPGSAVSGLPEQIESSLSCPFQVGRPQALSGLDPDSAARLTLSYGLALED
jgi:type IV pilus assembly protein PilM